jgi:hypothetical protein
MWDPVVVWVLWVYGAPFSFSRVRARHCGVRVVDSDAADPYDLAIRRWFPQLRWASGLDSGERSFQACDLIA